MPEAPHEQLTISLGTKIAEANADAVASTIQAVIAVVLEAHKQIKPSDTLVIKALPLRKGSFEIPLELIFVTAKDFAAFAIDNLPVLQATFTTVKQYFEVRKLLRGNHLPPPTKEGTVVIGNITLNFNDSTLNVLSNNHVNTQVSKAASDISKDGTIDHLKLLRGEGEVDEIANVPREELSYLNFDSDNPISEGPMQDRLLKKTELVIHTPVLEGTSQWTFILKGQKITVKIQDEAFMKRVAKGVEEFAAGDRLKVDLVVTEVMQTALATYVAKSYKVVKVHEHLKRQEQLRLAYEKRASKPKSTPKQNAKNTRQGKKPAKRPNAANGKRTPKGHGKE
jgi:hypothetical protein